MVRASLIPDFLFGKASGGRSGGPVIEKPYPHRLTGVYSFVNVGSAGARTRYAVPQCLENSPFHWSILLCKPRLRVLLASPRP